MPRTPKHCLGTRRMPTASLTPSAFSNLAQQADANRLRASKLIWPDRWTIGARPSDATQPDRRVGLDPSLAQICVGPDSARVLPCPPLANPGPPASGREHTCQFPLPLPLPNPCPHLCRHARQRHHSGWRRRNCHHILLLAATGREPQPTGTALGCVARPCPQPVRPFGRPTFEVCCPVFSGYGGRWHGQWGRCALSL
jgi:hypothetical protein